MGDEQVPGTRSTFQALDTRRVESHRSTSIGLARDKRGADSGVDVFTATGGDGWRATVALVHPVPVLLTLLATGLFAVAAGGSLRPWDVALVLGVIALSQVAIAVYNDVCDLGLDQVERPERALPRGLVSVSAARTIVWVCAVTAVALAAVAGPWSAALVALGTSGGMTYSSRLKRTAWSWLPFTLCFPLLAIWVFVALHRAPPHLWTMLLIGAPAALAIHLADSLPDLDGDARHGAGGAALALGARRAGRVCRLALAGAAISAAACAPLSRQSALALAAAVGCAAAALWAAWIGSDHPAHRHVVSIGALLLGGGWIAALTV